MNATVSETVSGLLPVLLGAGVGLGAWIVVTWLLPAREPLDAVMARALAPPPALPGTAGPASSGPASSRPASPGPGGVGSGVGGGGWAARWGRPVARLLAGWGLPRARVRADLATLGRPVERHLGEQATAALAGFLVPTVFGVVAWAALVWLDAPTVGVAVPLWVGLLLAVAGFVVPDTQVRAEAAARREAFRHSLAAYLDLVVIDLAGGAGVDQALDDAATVGSGWSFDHLRRALLTARVTRRTPWDTLARLGTDLGVTELNELAASVRLAGSEGARVRASLTAKAAALRTRQLSDAESAANSATERMSLPVVMLFAGFLLFIVYPAVTAVLTSL